MHPCRVSTLGFWRGPFVQFLKLGVPFCKPPYINDYKCLWYVGSEPAPNTHGWKRPFPDTLSVVCIGLGGGVSPGVEDG